MKVTYCDLCGTAIKNNTGVILLKFNQMDNPTMMSYTSFLDILEQSMKEICPTCAMIIDEIFKLRYYNLSKLNQELFGIYKLESSDKVKQTKHLTKGKDNEKHPHNK